MLGKQEFDLVVSDIKMDGMNGIELMAEAQKRCSHLDFIIMTGHATTYSHSDIIGAGAADYLVKPFEVGELGHLRSCPLTPDVYPVRFPVQFPLRNGLNEKCKISL